jgi:arylsulfatase A-like enzyme
LFLFSAWLGLLTGTVEAARGWIWDNYLTGTLFRNDHAIWMTPVAECGVFLLLGAGLWGLTCCLSRTWRAAVIVAGLGVLSSLSVSWGYLHLWAIIALSLGWAVFLVRALVESPRRLTAWMRFTTSALLLFVALGALWQMGRQVDRAARANVAPGPAAPNVLLIVWDTVRADFVDYRPDNEHTPHLAGLARQGVVFQRAIAPASWTLPTHASLFTGLYPDQHFGNWHQPLDGARATLAELYDRAGYATGGFVGNLYYCTRSSGLNRGFQIYRDHKLSLDEILRQSFAVNFMARTRSGWSCLGIYNELGRKGGERVTRQFIRWSRQQKDRPFFAFLNYYDAHDPYLPDRLADGRRLSAHEKLLLRTWRYRKPNVIRPDEVALARTCYVTQIKRLDRYLGEIVSELKRTGQLDRTLIVVVSDHGEHFGEHGLYSHGNSVYRSLVHVPLLMALPNRAAAGRQVEQPVSLCDVGRTLLAVSEVAEADRFPGQSLAALWTDATSHSARPRPALATVDPHPRREIFAHMCHSPANNGKQTALLTDDTYVISDNGQSWHMYRFDEDPQEQNDLVGQAPWRAELLAAQEALRRARQSIGDEPSESTRTWLTARPGGEDR